MIDLLPVPHDRFICPNGDAELIVEGFELSGMFAFARTVCPACSGRFLSRLHTDFLTHGEFHSNLATGEQHANVPDWYRVQLANAVSTRHLPPPRVDKVQRRPLGSDVAILNALDHVYGHCLHKLFSFSSIKDTPGLSTLAIVPDFLEWLVSEAIDEIWVVRDPRHNLERWNSTIADGIALLSATASRLRYVGVAWNHRVDIEDYTRVRPAEPGAAPARISVNWREDRCWTLRGRKLAQPEAVAEQLTLYTLLLETLRQQIPDLRAYVTGYGESGTFPGWVHDLRIVEHDPKAEAYWARVAGKSHLAVGVHGSNMIVPAALASSAIEIVPADKWATVLVTWEFANASPANIALARYRLLADSTSVSDIATVAMTLIRRWQAMEVNGAIARAQTAQEAFDLRMLHSEIMRPFEPLVCRDATGASV